MSDKGQVSGDGEVSDAEREVWALIALGLSNKEIANTRGVTTKTITNQITRLYEKIGVKDRAGAVRRLCCAD